MRKKANPWQKLFLFVALSSSILGALFATKTLSSVNKNLAEAKEIARPANIKLTKITIPSCSNCFNLDEAVTTFKKQNVSVGEEKTIIFNSAEGQDLVNKLDVKRLPTYLATGETAKKSLEPFVKNNGLIKDNTFIFTKVTPVFIDSRTQKEVGRVTVTYLTDASCSGCIDPKLTVDGFKTAGVKISEEKSFVWDSPEGQSAIVKYRVTKLPTFLMSSGVDFYDSVKANWSRIGTVESDGTYVARNLVLPYRDLEQGKILGLVGVIYLTDSTCSDCYKPEITQKNILTRGYGVGIRSERTVDINSSEGRGIVSQYKIIKAPTILMSPEVDQYVGIKNVWKSVGTVETNGWYIFREMQQLGNIVYKDLASNQIIQPASTQSSQGGQANQ